jgi:hypothetical protein
MPDQLIRSGENSAQSEYAAVAPAVNVSAEFFEIVHDFGDALELVREAISNSLDAEVKELKAAGLDVDANVAF